jgi:hypothetical protein
MRKSIDAILIQSYVIVIPRYEYAQSRRTPKGAQISAQDGSRACPHSNDWAGMADDAVEDQPLAEDAERGDDVPAAEAVGAGAGAPTDFAAMRPAGASAKVARHEMFAQPPNKCKLGYERVIKQWTARAMQRHGNIMSSSFLTLTPQTNCAVENQRCEQRVRA